MFRFVFLYIYINGIINGNYDQFSVWKARFPILIIADCNSFHYEMLIFFTFIVIDTEWLMVLTHRVVHFTKRSLLSFDYSFYNATKVKAKTS